MKKRGFIFAIFIIITIAQVLALTIEDNIPVQIQTTDSSGNIITGTFAFTINISDSSTCSPVLYSNVTTKTTDVRGIVSYNLEDIDLEFDEQYWFCYYRDGVLKETKKIGRTPYSFVAKNITLSGVEVDSDLDLGSYNLIADSADFGGGWLSNGVSIINGNIFAQVGYFYNITSLNVTKQNLKVNESLDILKNLTVDTNTLIVDSDSDRVGIGTTSPNSKLEVNGDVNASGGRVYDKTGYAGIPGEMRMYGGATAPSGWLLCDGASLLRAGTYADLFDVIGTTFGSADGTHFTLPDFQGIFPRGAGTSTKLSNANGAAFSATLGTYQNDMFQEHSHYLGYLAGATGYIDYRGFSFLGMNFNTANFALTDSGGTGKARGEPTYIDSPRTGAETNPANLGVTFIIKY